MEKIKTASKMMKEIREERKLSQREVRRINSFLDEIVKETLKDSNYCYVTWWQVFQFMGKNYSKDLFIEVLKKAGYNIRPRLMGDPITDIVISIPPQEE